MFINFFDLKQFLAQADSEDLGGGFMLLGLALFITLTLSCTGGYYFLRMACPFTSNDGKEKGLGLFWYRFKVVAVNTPSLLCFCLYQAFKPLINAEFVNGVFPILSSMVICLSSLEEKEAVSDDSSMISASK